MASWIKSSASSCDRPLRRRNFSKPSKCAGRDAMIYTARFNAGELSGMAIGHTTSFPSLPEDLVSLDDDVTRSIHADSDAAAFDIQDGQGDAVSDHQSFGQPAGQNEHDPLP